MIHANFIEVLSQLEDVTTDRQSKNGTKIYRDPQTNAYYGIYSTGYVRTLFPDRYISMYPLNKRKMKEEVGKWGKYTVKSYELIPNFEDRVLRMVRGVQNYRITHRMSLLRGKFPELSDRCIREMAQKYYEYFSACEW